MSIHNYRLNREPSLLTISKREHEILQLIANEFSNKEIASKLSVSRYTIDTHRKNLLKKMQVSNTAGLIRRAFELEYLP